MTIKTSPMFDFGCKHRTYLPSQKMPLFCLFGSGSARHELEKMVW